MLTAMGNVVPSHLMDRNLYPFETVKATGTPQADGDIAFDEDEGCGPKPGAGTVSVPVPVRLDRPAPAAGPAPIDPTPVEP
jgi:tRNA 2-thiocytidine biosynthesis protein TtcA